MNIKDQLDKGIAFKLPEYIIRVSDILISNGYEANLVGGSVRDILLGKSPKDYDIATNATPDEIASLFKKAVLTGAKFGTVTVIEKDEEGENFDVEVTTYRSESDYYGGRWPGKVEFTKNIKDDLARRDFTINAIAINLDGFTQDKLLNLEDVIDPFDGLSDIDAKIIRAVGDPKERFEEDGLRPIRACRIASTLEFTIEEATFEAAKNALNVTKMVSVERVRDELNKLMRNSSKPSEGFKLLEKLGILAIYIPELVEGKKYSQPEYHEHDVFEHSLLAMDLAEDSIKWAALLHDIGKVRTQTIDEKGTHYYTHDLVGAEMAKEILTRLRFPKKEVERISNLIRWHMFYYPSSEWRRENPIESVYDDASKNKHGWSDTAIRRFIKNVGGLDVVDDLIKLRIADATSNPKSLFDNKEVEALEERISEVTQQDMALKISDLDISGVHLKELGYSEGPKYREIFEYLLDKVIEDPNVNKKELLVNLVKEKYPV